jgi:beta-galactosidase
MKRRHLAWLFILTVALSSCSRIAPPPPTEEPMPADPTVQSILTRGSGGSTLAPSLAFFETRVRDATIGDTRSTIPVAWQSGMPVPSFDPQYRARLDLGDGTLWRKQRVGLNVGFTFGANSLAQIESEAKSRHLPSFNDSRWQTMRLPAVENAMPAQWGSTRGPEVYESGVWYRRTFTVDRSWHGRHVTLNFLGANYIVDVWINGTWIGYHEGGYTPFALEASHALRYGQANTIAIRVHNPAWGSRTDMVPALAPDWWNYTGVIQDVYLESTPALWVARADVLTPTTSGTIHAHVLLHNASNREITGSLDVHVHGTDRRRDGFLTDPRAGAILDGRGSITGRTGISVAIPPREALVVPVHLTVPNPALWSPANPNLYVLEATVTSSEGVDRTMHQFGIRTVATEGHQILLNGRPFFLAGIARHEEWPDTGRTATWPRIRSDLEAIRGMGANFLRAAHYPNHVHSFLLTDRLGLAAKLEIPVWQFDAVHFRAQATRRIADQMWREMILSNANRPSVLLWSTNNEPREMPERTAFNRRLIADFEQHLRDGRVVLQSAAADRGGPSDASQRDFPVSGWTLYFGVFYGSDAYRDTLAFLRDSRASLGGPVLATEYGIWSQGGWSDETRQQQIFRDTFRALDAYGAVKSSGCRDASSESGFVGGIVWWTAFDWYSAHSKLATMGLMHMDRLREKPVLPLLRSAYAPLRPEATLAPCAASSLATAP